MQQTIDTDHDPYVGDSRPGITGHPGPFAGFAALKGKHHPARFPVEAAVVFGDPCKIGPDG